MLFDCVNFGFVRAKKKVKWEEKDVVKILSWKAYNLCETQEVWGFFFLLTTYLQIQNVWRIGRYITFYGE